MSYRHDIAIWLSFIALLAGCSLTGKSSIVNSSIVNLGGGNPWSNPQQASTIHISYRTKSDRLNVAAAEGAYSLPDLTDSQLHLHFPHPDGRPDMALATLVIAPREKETSWLDRWRDADLDDDRVEVLDRRTLDVPAQKVPAIVDQLRGENFFQRSKPLVTESHVGVEVGDAGFAKDYRAVDVLDSLILKVYRESRSGIATPPAPGSLPKMALRRLPPTNVWMRVRY